MAGQETGNQTMEIDTTSAEKKLCMFSSQEIWSNSLGFFNPWGNIWSDVC
jgi:hypothetical protein